MLPIPRRIVYLTSAALLAGVLTLSQAAQAQIPPGPEATPIPEALVRSLAGCYAFDVGAWSRTPTGGPASPTTLVRLDPRPLPGRKPRGVFSAERLAPAETAPSAGLPVAGPLPPAHWRLIPPDSVEVTPWNNGFEAETFFGRVVGGELRGVVRRTSDAIPVHPTTHQIVWDAYPTAPATGRRVPCPTA